MATNIPIHYVRKTDSLNVHEKISHVGGIYRQQEWKLALDEAILGIERNVYKFHVMIQGERTEVYVAQSYTGNKYLKTKADYTAANNLLSLPEYP